MVQKPRCGFCLPGAWNQLVGELGRMHKIISIKGYNTMSPVKIGLSGFFSVLIILLWVLLNASRHHQLPIKLQRKLSLIRDT